jgi:hypothetical protein
MCKSIFVLVSVLLAIPCQGEIVIVDDDGPADYNNIQAAINDSNDGDVIIVLPGTYTGPGNRDIDFLGKGITVCSVAPDDPYIVAATVIDCNGTQADPHRAFYFHSAEDANSVVGGLTITSGYASGSWPQCNGGGILCNEAGPTITNCTIRDSYASCYGGGVFGSRGSISNSTVTGNLAGDLGGGLAECIGPITDCNISYNTSERDSGGLAYCTGPIINCTISYNAALDDDSGGLGGSGDIINCLITGNSAAGDAGAMGMCYGIIANCIITGNSAGDSGGALRYCDAMIVNCTIAGNSAAGGGAMYGCDGIISNCIVYNNRSWDALALASCPLPVYSCVEGGSTGIGCIDSDPCFVTPGHWDDNGTPSDPYDDFWVDGEYHLRPESPCIDTGRYYYCMRLPSTDYDCNTRLVGSQIDMGCYEFGSSADADGDWLADSFEPGYINNPDRDDDGIYDGLELLRGTNPDIPEPLGQWNLPNDANTIQQALFFSRWGETIALSPGVYNENINIGGRNVIVSSTDPNDPEIVAATIINGDADANSNTLNGRVITFGGNEASGCQLQGLTITGGCANKQGGGVSGGKIFPLHPKPLARIMNCTISSNFSGSRGGGLHGCDGPITKCTVSENSATSGGGIYGCDGSISNCIIVAAFTDPVPVLPTA